MSPWCAGKEKNPQQTPIKEIDKLLSSPGAEATIDHKWPREWESRLKRSSAPIWSGSLPQRWKWFLPFQLEGTSTLQLDLKRQPVWHYLLFKDYTLENPRKKNKKKTSLAFGGGKGVSKKSMAWVCQGVGTRHLWARVNPNWSCKEAFYCCNCKREK